MIISASRRTDIPAFYSEWFLNRIKEGFVLVPNPYNPQMVNKIRLNPDVVDCFVFWTKNPKPMINKLDHLKEYKYYFQFTVNPYQKDIESNVPPLQKRIDIFKQLADKIGKEKVVWRYDPILINDKYTVRFHKEAFAEIAYQLKEHTERCMLGFIDHYKHIQAEMHKHNIKPLVMEDIREMAVSFYQTIQPYPIHLDTCTVKVDLSDLGIPTGMCIDKELIELIIGYPISAKKDKNQRDVCQCIESIDIGTYATCLHGCNYCYAITGNNKLLKNITYHDKTSPKLLGNINKDDIIKEREIKSLRNDQTSLF